MSLRLPVDTDSDNRAQWLADGSPRAYPPFGAVIAV